MAVLASVLGLWSVVMSVQARTPKTGALPRERAAVRGAAKRLVRPPGVPVAASAVEWARMLRHWPTVLVATRVLEVMVWVLAPLVV